MEWIFILDSQIALIIIGKATIIECFSVINKWCRIERKTQNNINKIYCYRLRRNVCTPKFARKFIFCFLACTKNISCIYVLKKL